MQKEYFKGLLTESEMIDQYSGFNLIQERNNADFSDKFKELSFLFFYSQDENILLKNFIKPL